MVKAMHAHKPCAVLQVVKETLQAIAWGKQFSKCTLIGGDFNLQTSNWWELSLFLQSWGFHELPSLTDRSPLGLTSLKQLDYIPWYIPVPFGSIWGANPYDKVLYYVDNDASPPVFVSGQPEGYGVLDIIYASMVYGNPPYSNPKWRNLGDALINVCHWLVWKNGDPSCDSFGGIAKGGRRLSDHLPVYVDVQMCQQTFFGTSADSKPQDPVCGEAPL